MRTAKAARRLAIAGAANRPRGRLRKQQQGQQRHGRQSDLVTERRDAAGNVSIKALLAGSVDKANDAKNAKIHIDFSGSAAGQNLSFGGDGIADFAGKKFQLSLTLPAAAGISGSIEERVIGKDIYVSFRPPNRASPAASRGSSSTPRSSARAVPRA